MSELTELSEKESARIISERQNFKKILRKKWQLFAKIFELVLCVLCIGLVWEPAKRGDLAKTHIDHFAVIFTTFFGYTLITSIYIVSRIFGDKLPYRIGFIFSTLATNLFFVTGILLAIDRKKRYFYDNMFYEPRLHLLYLLTASSAVSFFTSMIFALEAVYIWKFREDF